MSEYIKLDDAIRTIQNEIDKGRVKNGYDGLRLAKKKLLDLRRATGKWEITINEDYRCDNCGLITSSYKANYCPNCGEYMRGDTE